MTRKRRTQQPEFKTKVALTALQGDLSMAEMVKKFAVHAKQIAEWKRPLLSGASDVFGGSVRQSEQAESVIQDQRWSGLAVQHDLNLKCNPAGY